MQAHGNVVLADRRASLPVPYMHHQAFIGDLDNTVVALDHGRNLSQIGSAEQVSFNARLGRTGIDFGRCRVCALDTCQQWNE